MNGKLFCEVLEGVKAVGTIETLLILAMAALYLAIMAGRIGANQLMLDAQLSGGKLKQVEQIPSAGAETIGKFKCIKRFLCLSSYYFFYSLNILLRRIFCI